MASAPPSLVFETVGDLFDRLGDVPPRRVRLSPPPGTATEADLLRLARQTDRLYELIDGTLVEKVMGYGEGGLAADLVRLLGRFLDDNDLGDLVGPDTGMRIMPGLVLIPDVSFIRWDKLPGRQRPSEPIPNLVPDWPSRY
ncbi:MAG: Uma2 family endonuclease [Gemmataceae bacterium]